MPVTRKYDPVFGWIVVPVLRWNGTAWVADSRPKAWDPVAHAWVSMNGCAVRVVGFGTLSFQGLLPSGAQLNIHGTSSFSFLGVPGTPTDPCVADGLYMEDLSNTLLMEDLSDCILMEDSGVVTTSDILDEVSDPLLDEISDILKEE